MSDGKTRANRRLGQILAAILIGVGLGMASAAPAEAQTVTTYATGVTGPQGLAFDTSGKLYLASFNSNIYTVAAGGGAATLLGATGDTGNRTATLALDGNFYVSGTNTSKIYKVTPAGVVTTLANLGAAVTADRTGLLYAVAFGGAVSKVNAAGTATPFGPGIGTSALTVATDASNNLYAVTLTGALKKISAVDGSVTDLPAAGPNPRGLVIYPNGDIYVADLGGSIYKIPSGGSTASVFANPTGSLVFLASDGTDLFVDDVGNNLVKKVTVPPPAPVPTLSSEALAAMAAMVGAAAVWLVRRRSRQITLA